MTAVVKRKYKFNDRLAGFISHQESYIFVRKVPIRTYDSNRSTILDIKTAIAIENKFLLRSVEVNNTRTVLLRMTLVNLNLFLVVFEDKFDPHRKEQAIWD